MTRIDAKATPINDTDYNCHIIATERVSVKAGLWTVDWTMDWVATHFIQSHPIHSAPLVIGLRFY